MVNDLLNKEEIFDRVCISNRISPEKYDSGYNWKEARWMRKGFDAAWQAQQAIVDTQAEQLQQLDDYMTEVINNLRKSESRVPFTRTKNVLFEKRELLQSIQDKLRQGQLRNYGK